MTRSKMMLIVVLMCTAVAAVVILQGNWLLNSYAVSKEKNEEEIKTLLDLAITEQKSQAADSVRHMMLQLVRSEKDFKYRIIDWPNETKLGITGTDHDSYALYNLYPADTFLLNRNPYQLLVRKMKGLKLDELYPLYLTLIGLKRYDENAPEKALQLKLSSSFKPQSDTAALKSILVRMFADQGRSFNGSVHYYADISGIYSKSSKIKPIKINQIPKESNQESSKTIGVFPGSDNSQSLARKLELLETVTDSLNRQGDSTFVAKPMLYNLRNISFDPLDVILLSVKTSPTAIGQKMFASIGGSFALMLFITLCVIYMYHTILKQKQLAEIKNDFISNITHELKTPIATAQAAVQGLKFFDNQQNPQKTESYLNTASSEIHRLSLMADKILNISIFESPAFRLNPELFNFKLMLASIAESQQIRKEKLVKITLQYHARENIIADKTQLHEVMINLIDNAIKYSGKKVDIVISCENYANGIKIAVTDNGNGIPVVYRDYIFDKFFRVPDPGSHTIKGYGLGLNYVKTIIEKHDGSVAFSHSGDHGSTFTIKLPQNA